MIMLELVADAFAGPESLVGPDCRKCGKATRVIGLERHWVIKQLTVLTFECVECRALFATVARQLTGKTGRE
jgi:hypothetical protein